MIEKVSDFNPDWVSPPGDTIADLLEERGWKQTEFAARIGCTTKHVSLLVNGKVSISDDIAIRLERVLGSTARFWLTREAHFRAAIARVGERSILHQQAGWLGQLPLADMKKFRWIRPFSEASEQMAECLRFFGVASVDAWEVNYAKPMAAFRASTKCEMQVGAVSAWLRQGERTAINVETKVFDRNAFREVLRELRCLTMESDPKVFVPRMVKDCAQAGVAVAIVPAPRGCPVSGAARWLTQDKALLMLSLRHKSNDHFWFSFFHEAGHILLHGKKLLFIDVENDLNGSNEAEANAFASDWLIPPDAIVRLRTLSKSAAAISAFASKVGVAPGIVVGRMQKEGCLPSAHLNRLKVRYRWAHEK
ncbi:MAG: XRE family transcriptional regulator [Acidobacteria bacterium]|nr:MAG: XRE family transcriptional regulator [Acidobacteriota bacterium]